MPFMNSARASFGAQGRKNTKWRAYQFSSFTFGHGDWAKYPASTTSPRQTNQGSASQGDSRATILATYNTANNPWLLTTENFDVQTPGFQRWRCPQTGYYSVTVAGAAGGYHPSRGTSSMGLGAVLTQTVYLIGGNVYTILVGKKGEDATQGNSGSGGGGGTFFFINASDNTPILAAGGGGGACSNANGVGANIGTNGNNGSQNNGGGCTGGVNGGISSVNSGDGNYDAAGGAGWLAGNGEVNSNANDASYGYAPRNGGRGGFRSADGSDDWGGHGGFGGGGGGTTENGNAGGGGGYSGGGKGSDSSTYGGGGGGGSYYSGTLTSSSVSNSGNGYVTITKL